MNTDGLPEWLKGVFADKKYRIGVLRELQAREEDREDYRSKRDPNKPPEYEGSVGISPPSHRRSHSHSHSHSRSKSSSEPNELQSRFAFYSVQKGQLRDNRLLNRYLDVSAYDRCSSMVGCDTPSGDPIYFNGNWVRERAGGRWWLATQVSLHSLRMKHSLPRTHAYDLQPKAPLPDTMHSFFSLCTPITPSHQRIRTIVQLTTHMEGGRKKADPYVPLNVGPEGALRFNSSLKATKSADTPPTIEVTLLARRALKEAQSIQSTLQVRLIPLGAAGGGNSDPGSVSIVEHFYFGAWPDHGTPSSPGPILNLAKIVDKVNHGATFSTTSSDNAVQRSSADATAAVTSTLPSVDVRPLVPPIMAHCSAGIGRTGTFIAISSILRAHGILDRLAGQLDPCEPPPDESPLGRLNGAGEGLLSADLVAQEVDALREQRPGMLQRPEQILFVYVALAEALSQAESSAAVGKTSA